MNARHPDAFRIECPHCDFDLIAWLPETTAADYLDAEATSLAIESE